VSRSQEQIEKVGKTKEAGKKVGDRKTDKGKKA